MEFFVVNPTGETIQNVGLPPSKSHLIRWLLMAAQSQENVTISGISGAAKDACSMRDALIELGVKIEIEEHTWTVHGVGKNGFSVPESPLNLYNSGTAFRLLSFACLRNGCEFQVTGDATLESRIDRDFWNSLGIEVQFQSEQRNLPFTICGPFNKEKLIIDGSKTSQYLSSILLSMPARSEPLDLTIEGEIVSSRHAQLSFDIAAQCGSQNQFGNWRFLPWECRPPSQVEIPNDASHISFWKLYEVLHGTKLKIPIVAPEDSIGAEILSHLDLNIEQTIDLRMANDLITPLAAALALGRGGKIGGASHARFKETNRIEQTAEMLRAFSIQVECTNDGLLVPGGQLPSAPESIVQTYGDHRMQMTASVLATKVGARIEGAKLHEVSFPRFLDFLQP